MTELIVGKFYDVSCAEIMLDDGKHYYIPIFDLLHADKQFGFPQEHYHIDGRFYMHPRMQHQLSVQSGHTSTIIVPSKTDFYKFIGIVTQTLRSERLKTGLIIPHQPTEKQKPKVDLYKNWYAGFIGKSCEGRKCPHLGNEMLEKNGQLVCPLHNITANPNTLIVI
jgi:hypothetical protein